MIPKYFRIQANERCELPSNFAFVDASCRQGRNADGSVNRASPYRLEKFLAVAVRRRRGRFGSHSEKTGATAGEFWRWVGTRAVSKTPLWIFAYNWHFVAQALEVWQELDEGRLRVGLPRRETIGPDGKKKVIKEWRGMLAIDASPFVIYAVGHGGTCKLVDVKNYFPLGISEIAKSFGGGADCDLLPSDSGETRIRKLRDRVDSITTAVTRTVAAWSAGNRGNWQPTASRLAYSNFRHEFLNDHPITIDNDRMDRLFQRDGFFGGEVSHWYRGRYNEEVFKVDVNSLYPSVMATENFPVAIKTDARLGTALAASQPLYPKNSMALVECYGVGDLPMRNADGHVSYPCGIFSTVLCAGELNYAVARGRIRQWHRWQEYEVAPIFSRFVAYWWGIREQAKAVGDTAGSMLAKMLMNSLFGRFAQRTPKWALNTKSPAPLRWGNYLTVGKHGTGFVRERAVAGVRQENQGQAEKEDTFPAISAFVASFARMRMRASRGRLPNCSVLCQSTDSLLLTRKGYDVLVESLEFGSGLGQFRLDGVAEWVEIASANHLETNHGVKLAGCPEDRKREGQTNRWLTRRPDTTGDVIGRGLKDEIPIKESTFVLAPGKTDRLFGPDGWSFI